MYRPSGKREREGERGGNKRSGRFLRDTTAIPPHCERNDVMDVLRYARNGAAGGKGWRQRVLSFSYSLSLSHSFFKCKIFRGRCFVSDGF